MKNLDRRVVRTRKALSTALIGLATEQGYERLSIRDLTKRANIGYATFYRHYKNKDELLLQLMCEAFAEVKALMLKENTLHDICVVIFKYVAERRGLYRMYFDLPRDHPVRQSVIAEVRQFAMSHYEPIDSSPVPLDVAINHLIESTHELLRWYIDNMADYSLDEAAAIYGDLIIRATESTAIVPKTGWLRPGPESDRDSVASKDVPSAVR